MRYSQIDIPDPLLATPDQATTANPPGSQVSSVAGARQRAYFEVPVLARDGADAPPLTAAFWSPATIHLDGTGRPLYIEPMAESIRPACKKVMT